MALTVVLFPGVAAAVCAPGFQDAGAGVCTATFVYSSAPESLTLPANVSAITAIVSGAEGGTSLEEQVDPFGGAASAGGKGGRETAVVPVAAGATLTIVVGQAGTGGVLAPPGYGGYGGGGHASSRYGGNGGGGSFVFDGNGPLVVAGGGGGGGYDYNPVVLGRGDQHAPGGDGSGASAASDGQSVPFCCDGTAPYDAGGGGGATATGPGPGGHPSLPPSYVFGQADGDPGAGPAVDAFNFGNGGSTHNGCCSFTGWAGGGGGGYYGGGGGGNVEADLEGGGGGGGAGYVTPDAITASSERGVQIGDGQVVISYYAGACSVSCATCSGSAASECTSCPPGWSLVSGRCVPSSTTTTNPSATTTSSTLSTSTTTITTTTTMISGDLLPDCSAAIASPAFLWPPNHRFVNVAVGGVTDPDGDRVATTITAITQDEPLGGGQGSTCPDATAVETATASLRAERQGTGDGRVYHVSFAADDGRGGRCTGSVTVCVPRDQAGEPCVDQGPLVDSTGVTCVGACTGGCAIEMTLSQPQCPGENLPAALMERVDHARNLISRAAGTSGRQRAKSFMRRGIKLVRQAVGIAKKAAKKGTISAGCADAVASDLGKAKTGADQWLRAR